MKALVLLVLLSACATGASPTPAEARQRCAGQMYTDRATRGRSAPNWNVYDYCVRQATSR